MTFYIIRDGRSDVWSLNSTGPWQILFGRAYDGAENKRSCSSNLTENTSFTSVIYTDFSRATAGVVWNNSSSATDTVNESYDYSYSRGLAGIQGATGRVPRGRSPRGRQSRRRSRSLLQAGLARNRRLCQRHRHRSRASGPICITS